MSDQAKATLYRMVLPEHTCPFGVRAKQLLEEHGYDIDDRILRTRDEVDVVEEEFGVATTPVVLIDGELVGGSEELETFLENAS